MLSISSFNPVSIVEYAKEELEQKKKEQEELLAAQTRQELHDKLVADKMQQAILEAEEKERRRDSLAEKLKSWRQEKEHEKMQQVD